MIPNTGQQRAIDAPIDGILNVTAGAGTGKTSVLVDRYLKLMRDDEVPPEKILALTFTLKAAAEMRHRIHKAVRDEMPEAVPSLYGAWIMNFHQFGFRLIKENAPALGINPDVGVMSPTEFNRIKALLARRFTDGTIEGFPTDFGGEIPSPRKVDNYFTLFFNVAKKARDDMIDVEDLQASITKDDRPGYRAWVSAMRAVSDAMITSPKSARVA
ncbi:MAG: UvrD-helicase domain-containing protein, partial [Candidatus Krumholzibacteriota bacterium]|nr:UvrD-helicase domain-containing protein [Candidatus Krumholzibacteriota bacterium]